MVQYVCKNEGEGKMDQDRIIETCLLAGKIMLQSGAETTRVEDTMERLITKAAGLPRSQQNYTYVTVNGIFAKMDSGQTSFVRIDHRDHNLDKVSKVNQISRSYAEGKMNWQEVTLALEALEKEEMSIPLYLKLLCTSALSGSIMLILGGAFIDLPAAMLAGLVSYIVYLLLWNFVQVPFLSEYIGTFAGGLVGFALSLLIGENLHLIMIGAVVPLVPGIAITNAIRDLLAKHYISGSIRALEGILIAASLGAGITTVYYLFII